MNVPQVLKLLGKLQSLGVEIPNLDATVLQIFDYVKILSSVRVEETDVEGIAAALSAFGLPIAPGQLKQIAAVIVEEMPEGSLLDFIISGRIKNLLSRDANGEIVGEWVTDEDGQYFFKRQLALTRSTS